MQENTLEFFSFGSFAIFAVYKTKLTAPGAIVAT
jgi:hypothetical protein